MRVTTKDVKHDIDGEEMTFQIKKMDALHGSCLMKFCAEKFLPVFNDVQKLFIDGGKPETEEEVNRIAMERTDKIMELIPKALGQLSDDELIDFERMCLRTVYAYKPAGLQPVMIGDSFGIEELEDDVKTVLLLCYEVVEFNMGSFFGGKSLASFLPRKTT